VANQKVKENKWWNDILKDCSVDNLFWAHSICTAKYLVKYKEVIVDDLLHCLC